MSTGGDAGGARRGARGRRQRRPAATSRAAGCGATATAVSRRKPGPRRSRVLAAEPVDIVVLDVGLPDMSGFEVCERIKADPAMGATGDPPVGHAGAGGRPRQRAAAAAPTPTSPSPSSPASSWRPSTPCCATTGPAATAEELAGRLTQLGRVVHDLHAATTFDQLARSLAAGTADALRVPRDGAGSRARRASVRRAVAAVGPEPGGGRRSAGADAGRCRSTRARRPPHQPPPNWAAGRPCWSAAGPASPRWRVAIAAPPLGAEQTTLLRPARPGRDAGRRRAAPLHRGAQHRADPTTQLPARADPEASRAWRSPPATCPPPRRPRSAATSTT